MPAVLGPVEGGRGLIAPLPKDAMKKLALRVLEARRRPTGVLARVSRALPDGRRYSLYVASSILGCAIAIFLDLAMLRLRERNSVVN